MIRMTLATRLVLRVMLKQADELYGRQVAMRAKLPSGTVQPILARLESAGLATSRHEEIDTRAAGRPSRRYYRLTPQGEEMAREANHHRR